MATPDPVVDALEVDELFDDNDSSYDAESIASSTTSMRSSIMHYREENGRTYHAYKDGKYVLPNDEAENDRQDLQNHLCLLTMGNKLYLAPLPTSVHRVLDVGTGTGIWAMDFADDHPESQVIGVDLSPVQPSFVPPNLVFEIDDLEEPWTFSFKFNYIHSKMMAGAFQDWKRFYQQSYDFLEPGGYFEILDIVFPLRSDDNTLNPDHALYEWSELMIEATNKAGRPLRAATTCANDLREIGFVDVVEVPLKWPINRWPKEPKFKELGMWTQENFVSGIEAMSLALFTRMLGWSREQVMVFVTQVRKDLKDTKIHAYWPIYAVYGKKP